MRLRTIVIAGVICGCAVIGLAQVRGRVWAKYEAEMQDPVDDPPDALRKAEFALGRLRYRSPLDRGWGRYSRWGIDVNKGDRVFISLLQRLTRIDVQLETHVVGESEGVITMCDETGCVTYGPDFDGVGTIELDATVVLTLDVALVDGMPRASLRAVERVGQVRLDVREEPRRAGDPPSLIARADRVRSVLGWKPRYDDLDTIVRTSLEWERRQQREPW